MLDEQADALDDALLELDDDSEVEDQIEKCIENLLSGQAQCIALASTPAEPMNAAREEEEEAILRASPRQSPVVGHAYDVTSSRRAQRFEPALGIIEEVDCVETRKVVATREAQRRRLTTVM